MPGRVMRNRKVRKFMLDLTAAVSPSLAATCHLAGLYIFAPGPVGVENALIRTQQPNNTQNSTVLLRYVQTYGMERYDLSILENSNEFHDSVSTAHAFSIGALIVFSIQENEIAWALVTRAISIHGPVHLKTLTLCQASVPHSASCGLSLG